MLRRLGPVEVVVVVVEVAGPLEVAVLVVVAVE